MCDELAGRLVTEAFPYAHIRGNLAQNERMDAFNKFRSNRLPILVSTDVCLCCCFNILILLFIGMRSWNRYQRHRLRCEL